MRVNNLKGTRGTGSDPNIQTATQCAAGTRIYIAGANSPCPNGYVFSRNTGGAIGVPWKTECMCIGVAPSTSQSAPAPAPQPAQIYTTVSPQIQVTPQVSPVLQQQFQPTNSPASAGTSQVAPQSTTQLPSQQAPVTSQPVAPVSAPTTSSVDTTLLTALLDAFKSQSAPIAQPPQVQQPVFQPVSIPSSGSINLPQTISSEPLPQFPGTVTPQQTVAEKPNYLPFILLGGLGLLLFAAKGKAK